MTSETLKNLINHAVKDLGFDEAEANVTLPDPKFGDYSTNIALVLAKQKNSDVKELAAQLSAKLKKMDTDQTFEAITPVGGFVNFTLSEKYLYKVLANILTEKDKFGSSTIGRDKRTVVEYFQNNVAKPPHVGHLRSAVIGDSLLRILRFLNFGAISDTHIGDWGTQFGVLILGYKTIGDKSQVERDPINELNKLYVAMSQKIEQEPQLLEQAKAEFAKLEKGDAENRKLWQWFVLESVADFEKYRGMLGLLQFDHNLGESFYEDKMPTVLADLKENELLIESEGAQIVNLSGGAGSGSAREDKNLGVAVLVKSDGATTYLLRDLATIKYRVENFHSQEVLYVVDNRQAHHFQQAFEISRRVGYLKPGKEIFQHIDFGFMSLPEGPISTRKGNTISLQNLIDEAENRASKIIHEKNPELQNKEAVAKLVALAAIKYFDLSHNRKTEIVFNWDQALSFEGNTGPYLQYTHARIHGILRKFKFQTLSRQPSTLSPQPLALNPNELSVLRKLNQFPQIIQQVVEDYFPNHLCNYLFELSQTFNTFYEAVPVLKESNENIRNFRLQLITATAQVIKNGLYLLGIEAPEEM